MGEEPLATADEQAGWPEEERAQQPSSWRRALLEEELESLPTRIAFLNQLTEQVCTNRSSRPGPGASLRVAAYTVWMGDTWGLRRALLPWLQWHTQLGGVPNFAGRQAVALAQAEGQHWLAHIDADELLLPATTLQGDLDAVPEHYACIRMLNHESLVE
ncbi:hypothetical protein HYH02_015556, partial [Chlamydomonas schloesseri]